MAEHTTGELAKLCGVTVRTVQYYDKKGLLCPSAQTEGGNRLYSEDDAQELRFIILLKSLGLGLAQIKGVLESPNRATVAKMLLEEERETLEDELADKQEQATRLDAMLLDIDLTGGISIKSNTDMAIHMQDTKFRRKAFAVMIVFGILMDVLWIGTLVYSILTGAWWTFGAGLTAAIIIGALVVRFYWRHTTYLCSDCSGEFKPKFAQWFFASHKLKLRKLTCACCGTKDWCVERWHAEPVEAHAGTCMTRDADC